MIALSADRLAFLATGVALSCWAPLVPFAKARHGVDEGQLGLLLLCLGFGSILAMPITGMLCARLGARPMILLGGIGAGLLLPALAFAARPWSLAWRCWGSAPRSARWTWRSTPTPWKSRPRPSGR
jgi:MFS family permease